MLYISFILHQTATTQVFRCLFCGCISPLSYIKPQPAGWSACRRAVVYLLYPTSNRNHSAKEQNKQLVVYLLYPTSNRNFTLFSVFKHWLYISFILHQTATPAHLLFLPSWLYISFILHQTATDRRNLPRRQQLYISFILHQTATAPQTASEDNKLYISFILHQTATVVQRTKMDAEVVYLLYPTSNRNRG